MKLQEQNPYTSFVQDQMTPGKTLSAEFLTLSAGPPLLTDVGEFTGSGGDIVYPIGIVQSYNLSQHMGLARVFEIGSKRAYFFPGKAIGAVNFARPVYHGPSLLRLLMAVYSNDPGDGTNGPKFDPVFKNSFTPSHTVRIAPGYENFFINLASDLFTQPHGELVVMRDTDADIFQTFYLEQAYIPMYNLAMDAQGLMYQEAVQVQFERLVPVKVSGMVQAEDPANVFTNTKAIAASDGTYEDSSLTAFAGGVAPNL